MDPVAVLEHLGAIQLDSISILARPQDLVPFSRIGPYDPSAMQRAIYRDKRGFEGWGHAACWLPISDYRYFIPRMEAQRTKPDHPSWQRFRDESGHLYPAVLQRVREEGP